MTLGPLEYTVIGFEGNHFDGSIADEIRRVVESGTIALVDVVFITKDTDGNCRGLRARQQGRRSLHELHVDASGLHGPSHPGGHRQAGR